MWRALSIASQNAFLLSRLEKPRITGTVYLPESLMEAFCKTGAEYGGLQFVKGITLKNKAMLTLDNALLDASPDGVSILGCGLLRIQENVSPDRILNLVLTKNCGRILCTPEQQSAVELVSKNAGFIGEQKEEAGPEGDSGFHMPIESENIKTVNAKTYIL